MALTVKTPLCLWSVDDVCKKLQSKPWATSQFRHKVRLHRIDGLALGELGKDDLRDDFGIRELGTVKAILRNIKKLEQDDADDFARPLEPDVLELDDNRPLIPCVKKKQPLKSLKKTPPHRASKTRISQSLYHAAVPPLQPPAPPLVQPLKETPPLSLPKRPPAPVRQERAPPAIPNTNISLSNTNFTHIGDLPAPAGKSTAPAGGDAYEGCADVPDSTKLLEEITATVEDCTPQPKPLDSRMKKYLAPFRPGILELERRYTDIGELFRIWDKSSDISMEGSGYIELDELRDVLANFYKWSDEEKEDKANALMNLIDFNCDGKLDRDEFHRYMSRMTWDKVPNEFDSLVKYLTDSVSTASRMAERDRREKNLLSLFNQWDWDKSGYIEADELRRVLIRYNDWSAQQGKHNAQVLLTQKDEDRDEKLDTHEFLELFKNKTSRLRPDEFDYMIFRIRRCVQDLLEDEKEGLVETFKPVTEKDLEAKWLLSTNVTPLICYGLLVDPSMQIEKLGERMNHTVRSFYVQHIKSERVVLREIVRWGMGRGQWIYITIDSGYSNSDGFLRSLGVIIKQQPTYLTHKKFRLWIMVNTKRYIRLPKILRFNAVPVPLDEIRMYRALPKKGELRRVAKGDIKLLVVLGSGGHTTEMFYDLGTLPNWGRYKATYVVAETDKGSPEKAREFEQSRGNATADIRYVPRAREVGQSYVTSVFTTLYASISSFKIVFATMPDVVLCNGPGTCVPICAGAYVCRILGLKRVGIIYSESLACVEHLSMSGKILFNFVDHFTVQWEPLHKLHPTALYAGRCAHGMPEVDEERGKGDGTALVTVGSTKFDALIKACDCTEFVDAVLGGGVTKIIIQRGNGEYVPKVLTQHDKVEVIQYSKDIPRIISTASLVITHAGAGTILDCLLKDRRVITVPNETLMANHQVQLAIELEKYSLVQWCRPDALVDMLKGAPAKRAAFPKVPTDVFMNCVKKIID